MPDTNDELINCGAKWFQQFLRDGSSEGIPPVPVWEYETIALLEATRVTDLDFQGYFKLLSEFEVKLLIPGEEHARILSPAKIAENLNLQPRSVFEIAQEAYLMGFLEWNPTSFQHELVLPGSRHLEREKALANPLLMEAEKKIAHIGKTSSESSYVYDVYLNFLLSEIRRRES